MIMKSYNNVLLIENYTFNNIASLKIFILDGKNEIMFEKIHRMSLRSV